MLMKDVFGVNVYKKVGMGRGDIVPIPTYTYSIRLKVIIQVYVHSG